MTGPFVPGAPWWMCAAVGCMPVTVMFADTVWSGFTVTVPLPLAFVVTGGTSLPPMRFTDCMKPEGFAVLEGSFVLFIHPWTVLQPATMETAATSIAVPRPR